MIYRVILEIGYTEAWFDFGTIDAAGDFAREILLHQVPTEDKPRVGKVHLDIIALSATEEKEEE